MKLAILLTTAVTLVAASTHHGGDWTQLARLTNRLAFQLHPYYGGHDDNAVYSPLAISTSLAMIYAGARGQTAQDFSKTFGYDGFDNVHQYYKNYYQQHNDYTWAYGVYVHEDYSIQDSYQHLIQSYYQTPVHHVDFSNNGEVRREINEYVKSESNGKFPEYLEQELEPQTRLYYLSAAYYGGSLKYHTGKSFTGQFHSYGDHDSQVPFWTLRGPMDYYYSQEYRAVRIPFHDNEELSLLVVVPEHYSSLDQIREHFSYKEYYHIWSQMHHTDVEVHLPHFSLDYYQPLYDIFRVAGYHYMFEEGADFSGLSSGDLSVSQVGHRAYFELEDPSSYDYDHHHHHHHGHHEHHATVKVDHPFLFYVVDHHTGLIHYSGYFSHF